jgi:hypothetical protein
VYCLEILNKNNVEVRKKRRREGGRSDGSKFKLGASSCDFASGTYLFGGEWMDAFI